MRLTWTWWKKNKAELHMVHSVKQVWKQMNREEKKSHTHTHKAKNKPQKWREKNWGEKEDQKQDNMSKKEALNFYMAMAKHSIQLPPPPPPPQKKKKKKTHKKSTKKLKKYPLSCLYAELINPFCPYENTWHPWWDCFLFAFLLLSAT